MDRGAYLSEASSWSNTPLFVADTGHLQAAVFTPTLHSTRPGGSYLSGNWGQVSSLVTRETSTGSRPSLPFWRAQSPAGACLQQGLGWPKRSFGFFRKMLGKNLNKHVGRANNVGRSVRGRWRRHWWKRDVQRAREQPSWMAWPHRSRKVLSQVSKAVSSSLWMIVN